MTKREKNRSRSVHNANKDIDHNDNNLDFQQEVEKGKTVKSRIRKMYADHFTQEKLQSELEYATIIQTHGHSTTPTPHARRKTNFFAETQEKYVGEFADGVAHGSYLIFAY